MSQHIQHHHPQPQYVHYAGPSGTQNPYVHNVAVAPQDLQRQHPPQHMHHILHYQPQPALQQHPQHQQQNIPPVQPAPHPQSAATASGSGSSNNNGNAGLVAMGDWTKDLVQLAKTAEMKKHALALQLHTAHILSAHATLETKSKAIQDIKEQKNKLESERTRLLNSLREINADRDKADLAEATIERECQELRTKIAQLSEGEYAIAKADVDRLRQELGQPPMPGLQQALDERSSHYLSERRINGNESQTAAAHPNYSQPASTSPTPGAASSLTAAKRAAPADSSLDESQAKRPRGRPKGSKNKNKTTST